MPKKRLDRIEELLVRLDAALVVREPGSARAAEAYDGLRKQVNQASKNRRAHVAHLLALSDSIRRGADRELVSKRVEEFLLELGVSRSDSTENPDWFEIEAGEGRGLEVTEPAVIETTDDGTRSVVRLGKARRVQTHASAEQTSSETSVDASAPRRGALAVSVGLAVLITGFFLGWSIASIALDDADSSGVEIVVVSTESAS